LDWVNEEIIALGVGQFFHADYKKTLAPVYGTAVDINSLVVEGGVVDGSNTSRRKVNDYRRSIKKRLESGGHVTMLLKVLN